MSPWGVWRGVSAVASALACPAQGYGAKLAREFDGARAFGYLERQMRFGPRIPGTPAHDSTGDWILAQLRQRADTVIVQDIGHATKAGRVLHLRTFVARFRPEAAERVLILAPRAPRPHDDQALAPA